MSVYVCICVFFSQNRKKKQKEKGVFECIYLKN